MSNQVFDIVQAMSGQGNCITIPGPYLDFFAGDRQQHLLAAILNQLVFWSGKSSLDDGWFYKEHAALAKEIRAKDGDVVRKAMFKITDQYLSGVIEEELRQVNGTPKKHYRVDQEALISKIFPQEGNSSKSLKQLDSALKPNGNGSRAESKQVIESNGNGSQAECIRPKSRILETALKPNPFSIQILKTDHYIQIIKTRVARFLLWITFLNRLRKQPSRKQIFQKLLPMASWLPMKISISRCGSGRPSSSCTNAQQSSTALWLNRESRTSQPGRKKFACCARSTAAAMTRCAP
ncbi:hypothetical protein ACT9TU_20625 [Raoultella planticola]|uniref:hypothetical protein n=1 Tax=Raoultella planticola TaxID=575 RepID=UPI00406929B4